MSLYNKVKARLETSPDFRERVSRGKFLAELALETTGMYEGYRRGDEFDLEEMSNFAIAYASLEREWRAVLKDNDHLQGKDYDDKEALSQEKQIELGYEVGYERDVKLNKSI